MLETAPWELSQYKLSVTFTDIPMIIIRWSHIQIRWSYLYYGNPYPHVPEKSVFILSYGPGGRLKIKMQSYQYRDSHVKDKTVSSTVLSLTRESAYLGKDGLYIETGP